MRGMVLLAVPCVGEQTYVQCCVGRARCRVAYVALRNGQVHAESILRGWRYVRFTFFFFFFFDAARTNRLFINSLHALDW